jgi:hypothetical protein
MSREPRARTGNTQAAERLSGSVQMTPRKLSVSRRTQSCAFSDRFSLRVFIPSPVDTRATQLGSLSSIRHSLMRPVTVPRHRTTRLFKEAQPIEKQQVNQMAGFSSDFARQPQSNPRFARLMRLADTKHCKGGG